jgi:hypothetical protein
LAEEMLLLLIYFNWDLYAHRARVSFKKDQKLVALARRCRTNTFRR